MKNPRVVVCAAIRNTEGYTQPRLFSEDLY